MTDIERKALALLNEVEAERSTPDWEDVCRSSLTSSEALCRAIERHEAFREEVSDAVEGWRSGKATRKYEDFIIAKPDPLVEALREIDPDEMANETDADNLRQALAARGLKITNI